MGCQKRIYEEQSRCRRITTVITILLTLHPSDASRRAARRHSPTVPPSFVPAFRSSVATARGQEWQSGGYRNQRTFLAKLKSEDGQGDAAAGPSREERLVDFDRRFDYEGRISSKTEASAATSDDDDAPAATPQPHRCGFVSIVGAPNMGKSTLLNALLDEPLAVATPRPQTTRHAILGVLTTPRVQLCFTDTPGIIDDPAYKLQEGMMEMVRGALRDADALLVVTDMFSTPIPADDVLVRLQRTDKPIIVCVNKVDLVDKVSKYSAGTDDAGVEKTVTPEDAIQRWRTLLPSALAIIPASASNGCDDPGVVLLRAIFTAAEEGVDVSAAVRDLGRPVPGMFLPGVTLLTNDAVRDVVIPVGPPLYDDEFLTDKTDRFCTSEIIRSSIFEKLGKEIPYCCECRVTAFDESKRDEAKKPLIRIAAVIIVERDSQKGIVVGKGGQMVKEVGMDAREKLEEFFGTKIYLELSVKVDKDWRKDETKLKQYGYMK